MEQLIIVKTLKQLQEVKNYIKANEFIAFDTETTGVLKESKIIGFSISADVETGYYVVLSYFDHITNSMISLETEKEAATVLRMLQGKSLVMHNGIFDCNMVANNYKINLIDSLHTDTMILGHVLNENRSNGLKELGAAYFGESAKAEQVEMKASVTANGGKLTKDCYELYKADCDLIAKYGAKDAVLTMRVFYKLLEDATYDESAYDFFLKESMPLLKGPTFELNTSGLKVDIKKLMELRQTLQAECFEAKTIIYREIQPLIKFKYPGTSAKNTFNIGSTKQIAWLLFVACGEKFDRLTDAGRDLCRELNIKIPYSDKAKREFVADLISRKGQSYGTPVFSPKTGKMTRGKTVGDVWNYLSADKDTLSAYSNKYLWVSKLLEYTKNTKLLSTYVEGILERAEYGMIRPSFLQHGTTSGRYSSKNPNFQNLPRDDKRIKACIVSRPGMVFVGADYSQLEPRVFASLSGDERLQASFKNGDDFYSVIGSQVFNTPTASLKKDDEDSFAKKHPKLRNIAKTIALSATYGTTAPKMAATLDKSVKEAQEIIDDYFEAFPKVKEFMLKSHKLIMDTGVVYSAYGRARHMPEGKKIRAIYGNTPHKELPYEIRTMLNLSVNHVVQSTGASIMNRAAIEFSKRCKELAGLLGDWNDVKILLQVHDELVVEGPEGIKSDIALLLKDCMENTVSLPGVELKAEPAIGKNLAELK